jgi:hypothetical protein
MVPISPVLVRPSAFDSTRAGSVSSTIATEMTARTEPSGMPPGLSRNIPTRSSVTPESRGAVVTSSRKSRRSCQAKRPSPKATSTTKTEKPAMASGAGGVAVVASRSSSAMRSVWRSSASRSWSVPGDAPCAWAAAGVASSATRAIRPGPQRGLEQTRGGAPKGGARSCRTRSRHAGMRRTLLALGARLGRPTHAVQAESYVLFLF